MAIPDDIYDGAIELALRIWRQLERSWSDLNSSMLTRIGVIVGAYILIRPYYVMFIEWTHKKGDESKAKKSRLAKAKAKAKTSPNTLRYGASGAQADESEDPDSEDEEPRVAGVALTEEQVYRKARRRLARLQRAREDEAELQKYAEQEWEDPDIDDLLVGRHG